MWDFYKIMTDEELKIIRFIERFDPEVKFKKKIDDIYFIDIPKYWHIDQVNTLIYDLTISLNKYFKKRIRVLG